MIYTMVLSLFSTNKQLYHYSSLTKRRLWMHLLMKFYLNPIFTFSTFIFTLDYAFNKCDGPFCHIYIYIYQGLNWLIIFVYDCIFYNFVTTLDLPWLFNTVNSITSEACITMLYGTSHNLLFIDGSASGISHREWMIGISSNNSVATVDVLNFKIHII